MRNKKKLISLIEKKMPEKDLFNRIENKIEVREKRRFNNLADFTEIRLTMSAFLRKES